ncbi:MAG: PEP-CTERM sorting domain-containing protein, partial [Acidobacteriota bacterium]|nr:PEP-CTERM sorting domain-containing protein [Acidobacteriota bacterium]
REMSTLRNLCFSLIATVVLCCASVMTAQADTVTFGTRAAFNAATTATTTVNFDGVAAPGTAAGPLPSFTSAGVTFTAPGNQLYIVDTGFFGFYQFAGANGGVLSTQQGSPTRTLHIVLPGAVTAVGFDTNNFLFDPVTNLTITATLSNGDVTSYTATPGGGFFGFTTTPAILNLTMTGTVINIGGGGFNIDNFTFGQASGGATTVPEPATILLLGTGLAGIAAKIRSRRKDNQD